MRTIKTRGAIAAFLACWLACVAPVALALDVGSSSARSLVDCDDLRRGATDAQARYVQIHTPRVDPVKTFDDATASCLEGIAMFDVGFSFQIPSLGDIDALLRSMATKLLQRACQAATQQFNRAVSDAVQSATNGTGLSNIPGVSTSVGSNGVSVNANGNSVLQQTTQNAVDRVVNTLK